MLPQQPHFCEPASLLLTLQCAQVRLSAWGLCLYCQWISFAGWAGAHSNILGWTPHLAAPAGHSTTARAWLCQGTVALFYVTESRPQAQSLCFMARLNLNAFRTPEEGYRLSPLTLKEVLEFPSGLCLPNIFRISLMKALYLLWLKHALSLLLEEGFWGLPHAEGVYFLLLCGTALFETTKLQTVATANRRTKHRLETSTRI